MRSLFHLLIGLAMVAALPSVAISQAGSFTVTDTAIISNRLYIPRTSFPTGGQPWSVAFGDFNKDGRFDIVSASKASNEIFIHLNDSNGVYRRIKKFPTGRDPRAVTVADVNGDGNEDVITITMGDGMINIHYGDGRGNFPERKTVKTGNTPHHIEARDLNGDGKVDFLVVANSDQTVCVHINQGGGNFAPRTTVPTGRLPRCLAVGDLNGDGQPDFVVGTDDDYMDVYTNQGGGNFGNRQRIHQIGAVWGAELADVNKDGKLDLVVCTYLNAKMCVFMGQGGGSFGSPTCYESGNYNFDLVVVDMDGDGDLDIATCSTRDDCINIHINLGEGRFRNKECMRSGQYNTSIVTVDVDNDNDADFVTGSIGDNQLNVHKNTPQIRPLPTFVTYRGRLYDEETGRPLQGTVMFTYAGTDDAVVATRTGADGRYELRLPTNRSFTLQAGTTDYPRVKKPVRVSRRDSLTREIIQNGVTMDIPLKKLTGALVYGIVRDSESGNPIPGVTVQIKNPQSQQVLFTVTTDAQGRYEQMVPFGNYLLHATNSRYQPQTAGAPVDRSDALSGKRVDILMGFDLVGQMVCIRGVITDQRTGRPIPQAMVRFLTPEGRKLRVVKSDAQGRYEGCVPMGPYLVDVNHAGYLFRVDNILTDSTHKENGFTHDMQLSPLELNTSMVLNYIYFDVNKATLRQESIQELDRLRYVLGQNPRIAIEISGHTDNDGTPQHNLDLSQRRAQAVVDYLTTKGVDPDRLTARGYGQTRPVAPNDTEENKQKNRRTEFKITSTTWQPQTSWGGPSDNSMDDWGPSNTGGGGNTDPFGGSTGNWGDSEWNTPANNSNRNNDW